MLLTFGNLFTRTRFALVSFPAGETLMLVSITAARDCLVTTNLRRFPGVALVENHFVVPRKLTFHSIATLLTHV